MRNPRVTHGKIPKSVGDIYVVAVELPPTLPLTRNLGEETSKGSIPDHTATGLKTSSRSSGGINGLMLGLVQKMLASSDSFFSGVVTVGKDGEEVDAHAYQVPQDDGPRNNEDAVVNPEDLEAADNGRHSRIHALSRSVP